MTTEHQQRERESLSSLILYHLFKWSVINPVFFTYFRGRIYGVNHVPQKGPLIIVSNHGSYFDPPLLSSAVRRPVAYMAKEELFKVPLLKQAIKLYGAYPVKRGSSDRSAIRSALDALQNGWSVGIFLEGTRTPDSRIHNPKLGAAMIAAKAQVPVLPVTLIGTEKILVKGSPLPKLTPVTVRIGEVLDPPTSNKRESLEHSTQKWTKIINTMHSLGH